MSEKRLLAYRCAAPEHTNSELLVVDSHAYETVTTETRRSGSRVMRSSPLCHEHALAVAETSDAKLDGTEVEVEIVELW